MNSGFAQVDGDCDFSKLALLSWRRQPGSRVRFTSGLNGMLSFAVDVNIKVSIGRQIALGDLIAAMMESGVAATGDLRGRRWRVFGPGLRGDALGRKVRQRTRL